MTNKMDFVKNESKKAKKNPLFLNIYKKNKQIVWFKCNFQLSTEYGSETSFTPPLIFRVYFLIGGGGREIFDLKMLFQ